MKSPTYLSLLSICLCTGHFSSTRLYGFGQIAPQIQKTALCFANIETGLIVYNIYSLEEICIVYIKSS